MAGLSKAQFKTDKQGYPICRAISIPCPLNRSALALGLAVTGSNRPNARLMPCTAEAAHFNGCFHCSRTEASNVGETTTQGSSATSGPRLEFAHASAGQMVVGLRRDLYQTNAARPHHRLEQRV